jgi:hypothetical protein
MCYGTLAPEGPFDTVFLLDLVRAKRTDALHLTAAFCSVAGMLGDRQTQTAVLCARVCAGWGAVRGKKGADFVRYGANVAP